MRINLKLSQQGLILVGVPIGLMLVFLVCLLMLLTKVEKQAEDADRSKTIIYKANSLVKEYFDAGSQLMIYKYTKSETLRESFEKNLLSTRDNFKEIGELLQNDPGELKMLEELQLSAEKGIALMRQFERELQQTDHEIPAIQATLMYKQFDAAGMDFTRRLQELVANEKEKSRVSSAEEKKGRSLLKGFIMSGAVAAIALGTFLALLFTKNTTSRLDLLMDNTVRLSKKEPLLPMLQGEDEIARLDRFFHMMADDLAEATRKERAILDNAVDVICSINADGKFTAVNPASMQVWGYPPEKLIGLSYSAIVAREDAGKFRETLDQIRQNTSMVTVENRIITPDKEELNMLWSLKWSESERSLFCVAHDVTDRKRVEQLKQDFLAVISHELRTPLTSLQATLTLLSNGAYGPLSESGERRVRSAESGTARLIMLINDLLDIEKMEAGKLSMTYHDVNLADIIDNSIEAVRGFAEEQGVTLEPETTKELAVLADADRLVQVIVNLLSNAVKFSDEGAAVQIKIAETKEFTEVQVIDHGPGIPEGSEDKIFAKYEQAHKGDGNKRRKGTGLGLPICKAIVEQHGGDIGVRKTEGGGSTFWFRLPGADAGSAEMV